MHATEPSDQVSRPRSDGRRWLFPLLLLVLCATLFFWRLGMTPLDDFDEAYYAEGAREMLERGDLGTPYYNGRPFLLKPILIYWLIAAAFPIFGTTEFAARSVSAFFATLIVLLTYCFATRTIGRRAGLLAGVVLALCYMWIDTGREAMIDMPLTAALAAAMFLFYTALNSQPPGHTWRFLAAYPLLGLALLAKGPAATGVVLTGLLLFLLTSGRLRTFLRQARLLPGLALLLAVAAPWYLYESFHQPEFVRTFLIQEHFGHLRGELARDEPWYGHLKNLLVGFYPWVAFLPAALAHAFRQSDRGTVLQFAAWWALAVIAAFSLAGAKLPHYLVPAFPPMAILVAAWFDSWFQRRADGAAWSALAFGLLTAIGLALAAAAAFAIIMPPALSDRLSSQFGSWTPGLAPVVMLVSLSAGALAATIFAAVRRRTAVFPLLAASMLVAAIAHIGWFKPRLKQIHDQPRKEIAQFAGSVLPPSEPLGVYKAKRNATIFYARRPIVDLGEWDDRELISFLSSPDPRTALTHEDLVPIVREEMPGASVWMRRGRYVLITNHSVQQIWAPTGATPHLRSPAENTHPTAPP